MPAKSGTINAVAAHVLGDASDAIVSRWAVQMVSSSFVGTVIIKGRVTGSAMAFVAIAYVDLADGSTKSASLVDTGGIYLIDASGLDVELDCTAFSSGSLTFSAIPLEG